MCSVKRDINVSNVSGTNHLKEKIMSDCFLLLPYPLVLVGHCVWSFNCTRVADVLPVTGAHRFLVGSTQRAEPVTSVKHRDADIDLNILFFHQTEAHKSTTLNLMILVRLS